MTRKGQSEVRTFEIRASLSSYSWCCCRCWWKCRWAVSLTESMLEDTGHSKSLENVQWNPLSSVLVRYLWVSSYVWTYSGRRNYLHLSSRMGHLSFRCRHLQWYFRLRLQSSQFLWKEIVLAFCRTDKASWPYRKLLLFYIDVVPSESWAEDTYTPTDDNSLSNFR